MTFKQRAIISKRLFKIKWYLADNNIFDSEFKSFYNRFRNFDWCKKDNLLLKKFMLKYLV